MSEVVANRYAEALFQLGDEKNNTEGLLESTKVAAKVFRENRELSSFLSQPRVGHDKKEQFLEDILKGLNRDVLNTIKLLVERHRTGLVPDVMEAFIQQVNDARGVAYASVYSARKLSEETLRELEAVFAKRFGKQEMHLENVVDPSVIGGVKVRVGNTIYDGSLSGKLNRMKREIVSLNK